MLIDAPLRWTDPTTWPWMVYVWLAFLLLGWAKPSWNWLRRKRATSWLVAEGRIESVEITKPRFSLATKRGSYVAEIGYSYSVAGAHYSGRYQRECGTDLEANEFVRDLQAKPVAVHYNPGKPSDSSVLEPDVEALLQSRAPADESVSRLNLLPQWTKPFLWFFAVLSGRSQIPFARYKGEAENVLLAAGFPHVYIFRPAYIYPVEPRKEPTFSYRLLHAIYPVFRVLFPNQVIRADDLARAMVDVSVRRFWGTAVPGFREPRHPGDSRVASCP
jgi:hypothetical protein